MSTVTAWSGTLPAPDRAEILRYMGARGEDAQLSALIDECLSLCESVIECRVCSLEAELYVDGSDIRIGTLSVQSRALAKALSGCERVLLFTATVGHALDRQIARESRLRPARALCLQAIGAERIEAVCNAFCRDRAQLYARQGYALRPRFSPGYGDLPLSVQTDMLRLLDCQRTIGVTLTESLMMSPSKSVSAIVGIYKDPKLKEVSK